MKVGILSERSDDIAFYTPFVRRLLAEEGIVVEESDFVTDTVGTHILKLIEEKTLFFFSRPEVDIAFYFSDYDDGRCAKTVKEWIKEKEDEGIIYPIIVCFPNPHMEGWFCMEQDAVKRVFGLKAGEALICHPEPKKHIHGLIEENDDMTKVSQEFYREIGEYINFSNLSNDKVFKNLRDELRRVIGIVQLNSETSLF